MAMPKSGPETVAGFERVAEPFLERGARRGRMFGMPVLKMRDRVFAGTFGDAMTFKLGPEDLARSLGTTGVEPFEPMPGRVLKEWVLVPVAHAGRWADLAELAFGYVASGAGRSGRARPS